ncbi:SDR family NAD(P)-dependent oxidoreductase [Roseobacter sp. HKCCD7870]|uniref:SDR family NAD(P)-dependent oxidoreductase n=1 Tax=Roseobacter sp. HKCCD7870 TaxID=3120343 RepID=UPI0030EE7419
MNYLGKNVLVTGADGFIGSWVTEALVKSGANVTALAQYSGMDINGWLDDIPKDILSNVNVVRGDIRDPSFTRRLMKSQEICMHLAALIAIPYSYHAPQSYVDVNITGTLNVLEAARSCEISRVIHTSTSEVYGTAQEIPMNEKHPLHGQSPYSASKIGADMMVEAYARSFDLPAVILRPFNTYGPRQSERALISSVIRQVLDPDCSLINVGDLNPQRDFTFVKDTADAFLSVGLAGGLTYGVPYNGGTGRAVSIAETVDLIIKISGISKPLRRENDRLRPAKSEVLALLSDNSLLKSSTGWSPQTSLEEGIERTIEWWRRKMNSGQIRTNADFIV